MLSCTINAVPVDLYIVKYLQCANDKVIDKVVVETALHCTVLSLSLLCVVPHPLVFVQLCMVQYWLV